MYRAESSTVSPIEELPALSNSETKTLGISPELLMLIVGSSFFGLFIVASGFFFFYLSQHPQIGTIVVHHGMTQPEATAEFILPATWTPMPDALPTAVSTPVYTGRLAVHLHRPRPPSDPIRFTLPQLQFPITARREVLDLARILQGESTGDPDAAYYVGWVAKNRHRHVGYGNSYFEVSSGFFGYRADLQPNETFMRVAERVIRSQRDPTGGCLYALSRTDITNLGIPPQRADVTFGEWFFFRTWPLG